MILRTIFYLCVLDAREMQTKSKTTLTKPHIHPMSYNVRLIPAHFHDVTHDKIKSNLIINIAGLPLNHS